MSNTIRICADYYAYGTGDVELPEGRALGDISSWFVKWDVLYITYRDGTHDELPIKGFDIQVGDTKRPVSAELHELDDNAEETGVILSYD